MKLMKKSKIPKGIAASEPSEAKQAREKAGAKPQDPSDRLLKIEKQLAEMRTVLVESEKDKNAFKASVSKAMGFVNAAKPEKLLAELQKKDARIQALESRVNSLAKTNEQMAKDMAGLKSSVSSFPEKGQIEEIKKLLKEKVD